MIIGIDLGTSTSEVAVLRNGRPELIRMIGDAPHGFLPSVVAIDPGGVLSVGQSAERRLLVHPERAVAEVKRLMGTETRVPLGEESYAPQEVSAMLLRHLRTEAERALGEPVTAAVITVPAYFTNAQRQATREAAELAGLRVQRLINEPTAAALAYGLERPGVEERIVVYDLGGGTFDVTVLELSEGVLDVVASTGNSHLGGKDFDERLMAFLADRCRTASGVDLFATPRQRQELKAAAKQAKEALSTAKQTTVALHKIGLSPSGEPIDFEYTVTRAAFDAQIDTLVESTRGQLDEALAAKGLRPADINTVLLVGGSTRVPLVREFVATYFGGRALRVEIDPDEAVALGAAVLAGIEARIVNPDQIVITDVAPHTLGVAILTETESGERESGRFDPLIPRQATIPRTVKRTYFTVLDNQNAVHVQVYQGEKARCADNHPVGDFRLAGLPQAPAGSPIEIEFSYNLNGELEVVARAAQWGLEERMVMRPSARHLSAEEKAAAQRRLDRLTPFAAGPDGAPDGASAANPSPSGPTSEDRAQRWRTSRHYSRVEALLTHAERQLPVLASDSRVRVAALIRSMRVALERDDDQALTRDERALTDLLFDLA